VRTLAGFLGSDTILWVGLMSWQVQSMRLQDTGEALGFRNIERGNRLAAVFVGNKNLLVTKICW
jgi:hypothetical protein